MPRPDSNPTPLPPTTVHWAYRCVCGAVFPVTAEGGACPTCSRRVTAAVVAGGPGETLTVADAAGDQRTDTPTGRADAEDRVGQRFGHFRIVRRLGQGGMGAVYQALDESLQRYVALKVIHAGNRSAADTAHIQRLQQEAVAQARVNHPHIVHIYFVGCEERCPFFAMELVSGPTLAERLSLGPLPFGDVVHIGLQVADALRHAAFYDILHGDIKPSNLLMVDARTVKLSDFGLARRMSQWDEQDVAFAGTPYYLPPETANRPPDVRSDIYSLGVTLFELTFGRLPYTFPPGSLFDHLRVHRTAPIAFPDPWPETVPAGWRDVLERLLAKPPPDRYQTYDEVLAALRRLRPLTLAKAGRVQRGLAWMTDLWLGLATQSLMMFLPQAAAEVLDAKGSWVFDGLTVAGAGAVGLLTAYLQSWWKTTPGKFLFQLRIVDRHGTEPPKATLAWRSGAQFLPLWTNALRQSLLAVGLTGAGNLAALGGGLLVLADAVVGLCDRRGQSLHDRLLRTQVVLQGPQAEAP